MVHERIDIPESTREAWQKTVDIMADIRAVPAALVMRVRDEANLEVFVSSQTAGNIFAQGETVEREAGVLCEQAIDSGKMLVVPNAAEDTTFSDSPTVRRGMVSSLGLPLVWPDGHAFGSICVMDSQANRYSRASNASLRSFRRSSISTSRYFSAA